MNPDVQGDIKNAEEAAKAALEEEEAEELAEEGLEASDLPEYLAGQALTQFATDIGGDIARHSIDKVTRDVENWKPIKTVLGAVHTGLDDVALEAIRAKDALDKVPVLGKFVDAASSVVGESLKLGGKVIGGVNKAIDTAAKWTVKGIGDFEHWLGNLEAGTPHVVVPKYKLPHPNVIVKGFYGPNGKIEYVGTQDGYNKFLAERAKNKIQHEQFQNMLDQVAAAAAARQEAAAQAAQAAAVQQGEALNRAAAIAQFRRAGAPTQASATQAYNDAIAKLGKASGKYKKAGSKKVKEDKKVVSVKKSKSKKCTSDVKASKRK